MLECFLYAKHKVYLAKIPQTNLIKKSQTSYQTFISFISFINWAANQECPSRFK